VEDESDLRTVMADSLSDAGFKVLEAEDGDHAVAILEDCERIDLLVTDIQMPGRCDGNVVAARARVSHLDLPVVYISGKPESLTNSIGPHDVFVAKPFRPSAVIAAIQRLLNASNPPADRETRIGFVLLP
jgi:CheY-like chemotaxis protein